MKTGRPGATLDEAAKTVFLKKPSHSSRRAVCSLQLLLTDQQCAREIISESNYPSCVTWPFSRLFDGEMEPPFCTSCS